MNVLSFTTDIKVVYQSHHKVNGLYCTVSAQCVKPVCKHTYLDSGILGSCDHDREDRVEYDTRDWSAVPAQGVSLWGAGDPLLGVSLLTHRSSVCHLLFSLIQLRLQLHHLRQDGETRCTGAINSETVISKSFISLSIC